MRKSILLALFICLVPFQSKAGILDIQEVTSSSGIKAWLVEDHTSPVISLKFAFRGAGAVNDPEKLQGLSRLLSNTLDEGAGPLGSEEFQSALNNQSISLSFSTGRDDFGGDLKTLTKNKGEAFRLLKLSLTEPRFEKDALDRMIAANVSRIKTDMTDPDWMSARLLNSVVFKDHPYGMNSGGTLSSLPQITAAELRSKLKTDLTRDRLIVSVSGDLNKEELSQILDDVFGSLPETSQKKDVKPVQFSGPSVTLYKLDIPQVLINAVLPGIPMNDPDYFTAEMMNFILGSSGFGSRLTEVIREKHGLTYGIYTGMDMMDHAALFTLGTSTKADGTVKLLDLTRQEFERIRSANVSDEEIKNARAYLIGSTPLILSSNDQIASMMLTFQRYGLPRHYLDIRADALRKITPDDIRRVANHMLDPSKMMITLVGEPEDITPTQTVTELPNVQ